MAAPITTVVTALISQRADLVLSSPLAALVVGGLLCLASTEDEAAGQSAQSLLSLALGLSLASGLAHLLAALLLSLLARA